MIHIQVPATTANLGPGFDILGMALGLYNHIYMEERESGLKIEVSGEGSENIPLDETNLAYQAMKRTLELTNKTLSGVYIKIHNEIPIERGLGSSAAVISGAIMATNILIGRPLNKKELLNLATQIEGHPDNAAAAIYGGIVASVVYEGKVISRRLQPPAKFYAVTFIPDIPLSTKKSREALPKTINLEDAIFNMSRLSLLIAAFMNAERKLIGEMMEDRIHQPYRLKLIKGSEEIFKAAKANGALSAVLSGAGSTLIAFSDEKNKEKIKNAMETEALKQNLPGIAKILLPVAGGAKEIKEK